MINRLLFLIIFCPISVAAIERVIAIPPADSQDSREGAYSYLVLDAALRVTQDKYGPYEIIRYKQAMVSQRLRRELELGHLSVAISAYKKNWEGRVISVPFPVYRGLLSYRMFFSNEDANRRTAEVSSIEELKKFRFGQGIGWSTAKILEDNGFNVVYSELNESLIDMLAVKRFDLFMRGSAEILFEWPRVKLQKNNIVIENNVAIFTYLPNYFYVSPDRIELSERLQAITQLNQTSPTTHCSTRPKSVPPKEH